MKTCDTKNCTNVIESGYSLCPTCLDTTKKPCTSKYCNNIITSDQRLCSTCLDVDRRLDDPQATLDWVNSQDLIIKGKTLTGTSLATMADMFYWEMGEDMEKGLELLNRLLSPDGHTMSIQTFDRLVAAYLVLGMSGILNRQV